jgi:hypothetical protein
MNKWPCSTDAFICFEIRNPGNSALCSQRPKEEETCEKVTNRPLTEEA